MSATPEANLNPAVGDPGLRAQADLASLGETLRAELSAKIALATELELPMAAREEAQEALLAFCVDRLLPHLSAIDRLLYPVADGDTGSALLARGLRLQHHVIAGVVQQLDRAETSTELIGAARAIAALLTALDSVERVVLWPAVADRAGADLLRRVGELTDADTESQAVPEVVDAREIPRGNRHPRIVELSHRLPVGASFDLVHNHDPVPLHREFEAGFPGQFGWEYLETGPGQWRVRITRLVQSA